MDIKLCCTLSPFLICEGCKGQWCETCWTDNPEGRMGKWGPLKYRGHIPYTDSGGFTCKGIKVQSDFSKRRALPIILVVQEIENVNGKSVA